MTNFVLFTAMEPYSFHFMN